MDIQKKKTQSRREYETAVLVLKTIEENKNYGDIPRSKNKQIEMLRNCLGRIGLTNEQVEKLSIIHVTGTKGKGSTCIFIEGILRNYGYKTGFFNSPHLTEMRDRVVINGQPVEEALFTSTFWHVHNCLQLTRVKHKGAMPGFFVFSLLMALHIFVQLDVDVVLLEVGIGGEYDATNFVQKPAVCGITSLHVEHTDVLGNTIEEIAWHKSGIMKRGVPMVTVAHQDSVMAVLLDRAEQAECPLYMAMTLSEKELPVAELGIAGDVQALNACLAVQICRLWRQREGEDVIPCDVNGIDYQNDDMGVKRIARKTTSDLTVEERKGLMSARLPGRCQVIKRPGVTYYLDGAHTTGSMQQCVSWFNTLARQEAAQMGGKIIRTLVLRLKKDKPLMKILPYLTTCGFRRAAFAPYVLSLSDRLWSPDALDLSEDPENARKTSQTQLDAWNELTQEEEEESLQRSDACPSLCFPSIVSALWWAGLTQDPPLRTMALKDLALDVPLHSVAINDLAVYALDNDKVKKGKEPESPYGNALDNDKVKKGKEPESPYGNGSMTGGKAHVQVLVTGSMALVGGVLTLLQPEV